MFSLLFALAATAWAQQVSFETALGMMVESSTPIRKAEISRDLSEVQLRQKRQKFLPSIYASSSLNRTKSDDVVTNTLKSAVGMEWNLFRFGGDAALVKAAAANDRASKADVERARLDAEEKCAVELLNLIAAKQEEKVQTKILNLRLSQLEMTRRLVSRGLRPVQESDKVEIDITSERFRLRDVQLRISQALAVVRARVEGPIDVKPEWPWQPVIYNTEKLQKAVLSESLEEKSLKEKLVAAEENVKASRAKLAPSLDLSAEHDWLKDRDTGANGKQWTAALTLTVPIYSKGAHVAEYREQIAWRQQLELELAEVLRTRRAQFDLQKFRVVESSARIKEAETNLRAAQKFFDRSLTLFQRGSLSVNDLNADQTRLYEAELSVVNGWAMLHRDVMGLCAAMNITVRQCLK